MVIVKMDKQGRVLIPASIRRKVGSELFMIEVVDDEIRLKPVKPVELTSLFDRIPVDVEDFTDTHALKNSISKR